jgi:septum formation protein
MSDFLQQRQSIILASGSEDRKRLLSSLGIEFTVMPAPVDEDALKQENTHLTLPDLATFLARKKVLAVSNQYPSHIVIGGDQLCVLDNQYFDKPMNRENAVAQLHQLQGKTHQLITATCIALKSEILSEDQEISHLTMRTLSTAAIERYIETEKPYNSCGSYHFEGLGKWLFKNIQGEGDSIQGLPLLNLLNSLLGLGVIALRGLD